MNKSYLVDADEDYRLSEFSSREASSGKITATKTLTIRCQTLRNIGAFSAAFAAGSSDFRQESPFYSRQASRRRLNRISRRSALTFTGILIEFEMRFNIRKNPQIFAAILTRMIGTPHELTAKA